MDTSTGPRFIRVGAAHRFVPWGAGCVVALLILGPVLRPGVLFNLDLIAPPRLETPSGFWGLGPELPRRLPMWAVIAWVSHLIPATLVTKALMFAAIAGAWAGMSRMVERLSPGVPLLATQAAAAIYAVSPFILTRAVVGHLMVTIPHALLPWLLPLILRSPQRNSRVFLVAAAFGATGHFGGSVVLCLVVVAAICKVFDRPWRAMAAALCAQMIWVVPGIVVALTTPRIRMSGSDAFPTHARGFDGLARLSAGGGFWNRYFQVGGSGSLVAAMGAVLLGLAIVGSRSVPQPTRVVLGSLGALGWVVAAASALGGVSTILSAANTYLLFGLWRDGQRLLTLHLLWLAPCASLGAVRLAHRASERQQSRTAAGVAALPLGIALALGIPGLWGFGGQLAAERLPLSWERVRSEIRADPGTVLVVPWNQYFNLRLGDGPVRRVLNPIPLYVGGDVLVSSDNGLSSDSKEGSDSREPFATDIVERMAEGDRVGAELGQLGVKWVIALDRARGGAVAGLGDDPAVQRVVDADNITLYRLDDSVLIPTVRAEFIDWHLPVLATTTSTEDPIVLGRPWSAGWFRGWSHGSAGPGGLLTLPAGDGPIWNPAALVVLACQLVWALAVVAVARRAGRPDEAFTVKNE